ncbi:putative hydroxyproline-rich glyco protein [Rosellinia necatrix]|uniref:Putative hydroxyproline-rich glyco protein n=1 Tax=Rosellinia necatrix TaxID=77044 RepID=A0A1W2TK22_ROSNE|nr:putative hydroxyproline-rich glyco protein [Rosellinia necatrix]
MEGSGSGGTPAAADGGGDPSEPSRSGGEQRPHVIVISERGDVILDATFQNSKGTIRAARKSAQAARQHHASRGEGPPSPPQQQVRLAFRADLAVLRRQSKYFDKLLGDARFREAKDVAAALAALSLRGVGPGDADAAELPWVRIRDDDAATPYAFRELAFADLLRILHGRGAETAAAQVNMAFVTTLAVLADRFDCAAAVSRYVATGLKFKWPVTSRGGGGLGNNSNSNSNNNNNNHKLPLSRDDGGSGFGGMSRANENVLRQKILVSWLLNQPGKFQAATRELIMNGSCKWSAFGEEQDDAATSATWWYLQDGLEQELQYRRNCILNTLASVPRHFLRLYTSSSSSSSSSSRSGGSGNGGGGTVAGRQQQCKLGYDSSVACDSYQLGEMFKFLTNKGLLRLVDFSPASVDDALLAADADADAPPPVDALLAALRQCPGYQIDKNHTNCGLRTRMLPALDFVQALLSAGSIPVSQAAWKGNRAAHAWMPPGREQLQQLQQQHENERPFGFTRSLAADQRLRFENNMGADKFARDVFTASSWDWTADDQGPDHVSTTPKWSFR